MHQDLQRLRAQRVAMGTGLGPESCRRGTNRGHRGCVGARHTYSLDRHHR